MLERLRISSKVAQGIIPKLKKESSGIKSSRRDSLFSSSSSSRSLISIISKNSADKSGKVATFMAIESSGSALKGSDRL